MNRQIASHETLLGIMLRKRQALQLANHVMMTECTLQENEQVKVIAQTERERLDLVGRITLMIDPQAKAPMKLLDLAQRLPEPTQGKILMLRLKLRERMENVQRESSVARKASETLLRHVQGLVQMIGSACTGVSTYSQQGLHHRSATAVSTFNATA
jgi:hypothetical protein